MVVGRMSKDDEVEILADGEVDSPAPPTRRAMFGNLRIKDDATLNNPSSALKIQGKETHIFTSEQKQIVIEHPVGSDTAVAKQFDETTPGLLLLRGAYTLMAVLMGGFLFVFCVQLILFLFLGLAIESGLTSKQEEFHFGVFFGTLLTIPAFLIGMANAMTIAMAFVADTWNGHKLMKTIIKWDSVLVDWISVSIYLFIPFLTGGISLCSGSGKWWEHTCIAWIVCVFAYYVLFAGVTIWYEIDGCLEMIEANTDAKKHSIRAVKEAILLKQRSMLSGFRKHNFLLLGSDEMDLSDFSASEKRHSAKGGIFPSIGPLSFLTTMLSNCGCMYQKMDPPVRIFSVDEVRGYTPFVTSQTWGLEKMYCRNRKTSTIAVLEGQGALTDGQAKSTFWCYILGLLVTLFLIIAALTWFETSPAFRGVASALFILAIFKQSRQSFAINKIRKKMLKDDRTFGGDKSDTVTHVRSTFRINQPLDAFSWTVFGLEVLFLGLLPLIALFAAGNIPVGIVFIPVVGITGARRFMSAVICFREFGTMDGIEQNNESVENLGQSDEEKENKEAQEWREKHRLEMIVSQISTGHKKDFWVNTFAFFIVIFCAIFMSAVALGTGEGHEDGLKMSSNHKYEGSGNLRYASCQLGQGIVTPAGSDNSMVDFTFLSTAAYNSPGATQDTLDTWFGADAEATGVVDHQEIVAEFKANYEAENGKSSVTYKYVGFPNQNLGVVSIRGTSNSWDALTDAQLWSSAALSQYIRAILPLGSWLTPILKYLVKVVSLIESSRLEEISYYRETTKFVEYLKDSGVYENTVITGHSLGGGLAMITGAQSKIPSIGLSGPNAMISRLTFDPPIEEVDLERYTFNIVPDRDPVPRIDDLSQNYQRISCTSDPNAPVDCHFGVRSLCEILYTCGSEGRPIPCDCVNKFEYPAPDQIDETGTTFTDFCVE